MPKTTPGYREACDALAQVEWERQGRPANFFFKPEPTLEDCAAHAT